VKSTLRLAADSVVLWRPYAHDETSVNHGERRGSAEPGGRLRRGCESAGAAPTVRRLCTSACGFSGVGARGRNRATRDLPPVGPARWPRACSGICWTAPMLAGSISL